MTVSRSIQNKPEVDISLVVPAYNEFLRLPLMLQLTLEYLNKLRDEKGVTYEVLAVCVFQFLICAVLL